MTVNLKTGTRTNNGVTLDAADSLRTSASGAERLVPMTVARATDRSRLICQRACRTIPFHTRDTIEPIIAVAPSRVSAKEFSGNSVRAKG